MAAAQRQPWHLAARGRDFIQRSEAYLDLARGKRLGDLFKATSCSSIQGNFDGASPASDRGLSTARDDRQGATASIFQIRLQSVSSIVFRVKSASNCRLLSHFVPPLSRFVTFCHVLSHMPSVASFGRYGPPLGMVICPVRLSFHPLNQCHTIRTLLGC